MRTLILGERLSVPIPPPASVAKAVPLLAGDLGIFKIIDARCSGELDETSMASEDVLG